METQRARRGLIASEPVLLLATVIAVLYFGRAILIPVALALTLNFLLAPAVIYLHRFRLSRVPAVIIVVVIAGAVVGGIGWVVASQLVRIAEDLPSYRANLQAKMTTLHAPSLSPVGKAIRGVREVGRDLYGGQESAPPAASATQGAKRPIPQGTPPRRVPRRAKTAPLPHQRLRIQVPRLPHPCR